MVKSIGIIGIGAWATALSILLSENGYSVVVWSHEEDTVEKIKKSNVNEKYLPNVKIPSEIVFTTKVEVLNESDLLIQGTPTQFIRKILENYGIEIKGKRIVNVAKGIEKVSLKRISEILIEFGVESKNYSILTGPSHAEEVARKVPTAVVVAAEDQEFGKMVQKIFSNAYFRVYTSNDVVGCELGGALKNVIAIAAGIVDGLQLGDNSKAALITRGLAEVTRLGVAMGANPLTFSGLSGLGDLIVTCNSKFSRNRFVGEQIAKGRSLQEIVNRMFAVAEGVDTTISAYQLGLKHKVELPITKKVYEILFENLNPREALMNLMLRETKPEWWW